MPDPHGNLPQTCIYYLQLQRLQSKVGNFARDTRVRNLHVAVKIPYVYDFITKLCMQQAEVKIVRIQLFATCDKDRNSHTCDLKSGHDPQKGSTPRQAGCLAFSCKITWTWTSLQRGKLHTNVRGSSYLAEM
jgi:hypothetical protein